MGNLSFSFSLYFSFSLSLYLSPSPSPSPPSFPPLLPEEEVETLLPNRSSSDLFIGISHSHTHSLFARAHTHTHTPHHTHPLAVSGLRMPPLCIGDESIVSEREFTENFREFTEGVFDGEAHTFTHVYQHRKLHTHTTTNYTHIAHIYYIIHANIHTLLTYV